MWLLFMRIYSRYAILLTCLLVALGPSLAASIFDEAVNAYDNKNYSKASELFLIEANKGNVNAQYNLGVMYSNGRGVPQNYHEAARWYRLAAEQQNAKAQTKLGDLYYIGQGVPRDYKKAVEWYRLAAEQGDMTAQLYLGDMYYKGQGLPKNITEAYAWWIVAAANGNQTARHNLDMARKKMTSSEVEEAQMLAKEYAAKTIK
jgi:hypothetical protein